MKFRLIQDPDVALAVSFLSPAMQDWYHREIVPILIENPYPAVGFPLIKQYIGSDGRIFYQYYDGVVPLYFQYRVYPSDVDSRPGMIWLAAALGEDEI